MSLGTVQAIVKECSVSTHTNPSIKLVEKANKSRSNSLSEVVIEKSHGSVWFSVDRKGKSWSPYLADTNGFHKRCDYVIMNNRGGTARMVFVELKSGNAGKEELIEKFRATECFMDYCESISDKFFNKSILNECEKRFVVFHLPLPLAKTTTCPELASHDKPENAKLIAISNRSIFLKQLL